MDSKSKAKKQQLKEKYRKEKQLKATTIDMEPSPPKGPIYINTSNQTSTIMLINMENYFG